VRIELGVVLGGLGGGGGGLENDGGVGEFGNGGLRWGLVGG